MMRKRNRIAYTLLSICLLMQIAMAFPHHHHSETYCFHADVLPCSAEDACTDGMHHANDEDKHGCGTACVSQMMCGAPSHSVQDCTPDYSFYSILYSLSSDIFRILPCEAERVSEVVYIEILHARSFVRSSGRRAPPVV